MKEYAHLYQLLQSRLEAYTTKLVHEPFQLYAPMQYMLELGGKRLRPMLALIACDLFDKEVERAIPVALAIELFHNFSLVHDDIMDKAPLRRGKATIHEKWNTPVAILSGDAMLIKAYEELLSCKTEHIPALLQLFNKTAVGVCEGQQYDMNFEAELQVNIENYIQMIGLKTAVLLGCSLQMGAIVADAPDNDTRHLYQTGKEVGIAFQLHDDLLDVYGASDKTGKQVGGDIIANKKTYLLLKTQELANSSQKAELEHWLNLTEFSPTEKVKAIRFIFDQLNIQELTRERMMSHYQAGINHIQELSCAASKKLTLKHFLWELMQREH